MTRRQLRQGWRWLRWRVLFALVVFAAGLSAFMMGAEVSARPGISGAPLATQVYYTLGLFVLGGMDLGVPEGGPALAQSLLWVAYFTAPLISAMALIEAALRAIRPNRWRLRGLRDHIVIGGCGRLTMLFLERLRESDEGRSVVILERHTDQPLVEEARDRFHAQVVWGDIGNERSLGQLDLERARAILFLTGDDFANLDAAFAALSRAPGQAGRVTAHVGNLRTMSAVTEATTRAGCEVFNSHQSAARHLVTTKLIRHFAHTAPRDVVILAGFGRFGQTVLDELQRRAGERLALVVIVDEEADQSALIFDEQVGFRGDYRRVVVNGDLRDPRTWRQLQERVDLRLGEPVIVLGSGVDAVNIEAALTLRGRFPDAYIVARSFHTSRFCQTMAAAGRFELIAVSDLMVCSMPERWFLPR